MSARKRSRQRQKFRRQASSAKNAMLHECPFPDCSLGRACRHDVPPVTWPTAVRGQSLNRTAARSDEQSGATYLSKGRQRGLRVLRPHADAGIDD
jgi:hypothetical protein